MTTKLKLWEKYRAGVEESNLKERVVLELVNKKIYDDYILAEENWSKREDRREETYDKISKRLLQEWKDLPWWIRWYKDKPFGSFYWRNMYYGFPEYKSPSPIEPTYEKFLDWQVKNNQTTTCKK